MSEKDSERDAGAWIGQHPDENTEEIRKNLDDGAERVSVTNNEADDAVKEADPPRGHRQA